MITDRVMDHFKMIANVPHPSGHCSKIADMLEGFAAQNGLWCRRDAYNNVIIKKPASPGRENDSAVMIQGHTDMVGEAADGYKHSFPNDPLKLIENGDILKAEGTTLGGDDGIAVAMMMALLESDELDAPALECVFTSDEEIGMLGAIGIDLSDMKAKYLINADSDEEGVFTCGCCGGACIDFSVPITTVKHSGNCISVSLYGLAGGHSGTEINKGRLNAVKLMADLLSPDNGIVGIWRDGKDNAIPARCDAVITANKVDILRRFESLRSEWAKTEPGVTLEVCPCEAEQSEYAWDAQSAERILELLRKMPFGVSKMCEEPKGLVHTSDNIGIINSYNDRVCGTVSVRSISADSKDELCRDIITLCRKAGGEAELFGEYPGWEYNSESKLRDTMCLVWEDMFDTCPKIDVIHAGLECGVILSKMPWLDIVSVGVDLKDIHTPSERMSISSAKRCTEFICQVLQRIK